MNMQILFILQRVTETLSAAKAAGWRPKKSHNQTNAVHIFFFTMNKFVSSGRVLKLLSFKGSL